IDVAPGDLVRVSGIVDEFFNMTEITSVDNLLLCGSGTVAPTTITFPTDLEPYEGMLVTVENRLYISEYFNFDRFGEIVLTPERQFQPTAVYTPGSPEASALMAENLANRITLDDGRTSQNPDPAIHPNGAEFTLDNLFRGGDGLDNVTGVIDYRFDLYRIQPTTGADYVSLNPRTAAPDPVGGSLQVASFNVLNYFNGDGQGGGFPTARGASDLAEFNRQRDKIIAALVTIDADVVGLMEIENDGYGQYAAIADLVNGLNDATAPGTYAFINPGVPVIGTDEIAVGLIYKPASVTPFGASAILDSSVDIRFDDTKNRPALAQSFIQNSDGAVFTVVVNHLKSKGSACDGDPDLGDGAGNCNITRTLAAQALVDWLASDPTGSGDPDALIIGDLNSYDKEDPIMAILAGPDDLAGTSDDYTDMAFAFGGEFAYSYVFDGALGYLDYALANSSLAGQVTGTTEWHINADEPDLIDYDMSFKQDAQDLLYNADPYRASDHDPVIVGLDLTAPSAGHVTGGGWLIAPAGSLVAAPEASGRANFGFNAKYKKNGRLNSETEFQVQFDDFHFHAKNAQWLLVSGANAYYFGQGRVEESNHTYSFLVSIIDGKLSGGEDMFRIQIWDMSAGNALVFDSQPGDATYADPTTTLGGGSIVIH
ncbi:MAG: ExeM/NucH family extracellular endonuclease, partial [Anaerolineales bacterium]|nr:ExeM/NucH family extracellular endonuclease [Anaerolineales bacterium]